ncbi:MAG: hypothetical protein JNJ88_00840 [Planctomycetes bacterium]|nr:hypothetical protein [Planctomycetota bacterium]
MRIAAAALGIAFALVGLSPLVDPRRGGATQASQPQPMESAPQALAAPGGFLALPSAAFRPHPYAVYELREGATLAVGENATTTIGPHGYRGAALAAKSANELRILCLGGSRMFGLELADAQTVPERLRAHLGAAAAQRPVHVANVATPGHTSHEVAATFAARWLDLEPDVIVVGDLDGDVYPALQGGFRDDYSHAWRIWVEQAGEPADATSLRRRVSWGNADSAQTRAQAIHTMSAKPYESNLCFLADVAAGRGIRSVWVLPDPARNTGEQEELVTTMLRRTAERIAKGRGIAAVDDMETQGAGVSAAARADALAKLLAGKVQQIAEGPR